jgi:zinc transport system substrate-binding protein
MQHRRIALVAWMASLVLAAPAHADKPLVVATFYPLYEFARQVAGGHAEVVALVPPGVEPHDWEPAPQDVVRLRTAKLFVYNGAGFEPWVDRLRPELASTGAVVVRTTERLSLLKGEREHDHERSHGSHGSAAPGAHGRGELLDPHVWLDPLRAQAQVEAIRAGLATVDSANAAHYAANARTFRAELAALDQAFQAGLRSCARKEVVTSHAAFGYLTQRYGLTQIPIHGLAPDIEPSPADLADLVKVAREKQVKYVFFETLVSKKLAETLAREVGARTLVLNPIEGLTPAEQAAGKSYLSLMADNLRHLRLGLDCR